LPGDAAGQRRVIESALGLVATPSLAPPVLVDFEADR
jgi:hypothetical protein